LNHTAQNGKHKIRVLLNILKKDAGKNFLWNAYMQHTQHAHPISGEMEDAAS
jgi:hypothetical protein